MLDVQYKHLISNVKYIGSENLEFYVWNMTVDNPITPKPDTEEEEEEERESERERENKPENPTRITITEMQRRERRKEEENISGESMTLTD